jgi:adenylosuccinate synthase
MSTLSVFGAQWGDEGKGKIIDLLACDADVVVRCQGGANAGHTVVVGEQRFVLHHLPSGILHPGTVNVVGNGVAVDPLVLFDEIDGLVERGISVTSDSLRVAAGAHVIFEHHKRIDRFAERWRGVGRIGTTGRGIGPCYADKAARTGLRVADLVEPVRFEERIGAALAEKNALFEKVYGEEAMAPGEVFDRYAAIAQRLAPFVADTGEEVRSAYKEGKRILFEGAQGAMLDLDHGTYPFVTSSNTGIASIGSGGGFPPTKLERVQGIAKAYCTRVGEGPFPSEDSGALGECLRDRGNEYGATTGRPRRCGWIDLVALRFALELNGATGWVMTNLDVLSGFDGIPVCTGYNYPSRGDREPGVYPGHLAGLDDVSPVLETRPGWSEDITGVRHFKDLPQAARDYVHWIEEKVGVPIELLSVGPARDQVIFLRTAVEAAT